MVLPVEGDGPVDGLRALRERLSLEWPELQMDSAAEPPSPHEMGAEPSGLAIRFTDSTSGARFARLLIDFLANQRGEGIRFRIRTSGDGVGDEFTIDSEDVARRAEGGRLIGADLGDVATSLSGYGVLGVVVQQVGQTLRTYLEQRGQTQRAKIEAPQVPPEPYIAPPEP